MERMLQEVSRAALPLAQPYKLDVEKPVAQSHSVVAICCNGQSYGADNYKLV